jgi:DNA-binding PadR family transcriptional regulator
MVSKISANLAGVDHWAALIKKSTSRYFLLDMLAQGPMHGYEIAKSIEDFCDGWCKPTDGMIYPTLKEMVAGGYVECTSEVIGGRQRKVYSHTNKGHKAY